MRRAMPDLPHLSAVLGTFLSQADRGRTSLYGREPNAGAGLFCSPKVLPTIVPAELSKSHSTITCIAMGKRAIPTTQFDSSYAFFRSPARETQPYVYESNRAPAAGSWTPRDRPSIAMADDRAAGTPRQA